MMSVKKFRAVIWKYWRKSARDFPWRPPTLKLRKDKSLDPYRILVSEIMLQQTQVDRVVPYFNGWMEQFPNFKKLATAPTADVLKAWQGLGYNRRALALKRAAEQVVREHQGVLPSDGDALQELPGVGAYTAGAVRVFAFGQAVPLVETNIRRVYIHFFFKNKKGVSDTEILKLVERSLPTGRQARAWFSALMDYGAYLASRVPNPNRRSASYTRQPRFEGSRRQLRGAIVRIVSERGFSDVAALAKRVRRSREEVRQALAALAREGFLKQNRSRIVLV